MGKGFDLGGLFRQAQELQTKLAGVQQELAERTVEASAGGGMVTAVVNGKFELVRMIATARAHGMLVMVGCMIETSLGITAAAHFTPLVDAADLDGAALTVDDPFTGATIEQGQIRLPMEPGLGVTRK